MSSDSDHPEGKRSEEALRESDARQKALLDALPDLMFRLSRSGVHLDFHAPAHGDLLVAPEAFMGKTVGQVLPPEVAGRFMAHIQATLDSGRPRRFDYELSFSDRGLRCYEARMVGSGPDEVIVIVRDMTERRRLEEQLRQTQKMEALGQLAAGVAHDFNNILTAILGNAELASRAVRAESPELLEESLRQIAESARSAAGLTKRLLAFTRQASIEPAVLDLSVVLSRMTAVLRRIIGENIGLFLSSDPDLRSVRADIGQVEQVVINLVVNARDAIRDHGKIEVRVSNLDLDAESNDWPGAAPGEYVLLAVEDDGRGMDDDTAARAFEPFFTTKPVGEGTGLGLATVYGIVNQCGGRIQLSTAPGAGALFKVLLPAAQRVEEPPSPGPQRGPAPGPGIRVLVCEDEPAVRDLMVAVLADAGYEVIPAGSGEAALRKAEEAAGVDLLVTDVIMPHMNGRELSDALVRRYPRLRTLFVSGYASDHLSLRDRGPVALLQKPFDGDELLARVGEVLTPHR